MNNDNLKQLIISNITKLYECKELLKSKYLTINLDTNSEFKKDANSISFKLHSYKKWLRILNALDDNDFISLDSLKKVINSKSLIAKIEEIQNTKTLKDINETKILIKKLDNKTESTFTKTKLAKNKDFFKKSKNTHNSKHKLSDIRNLQRINGFGDKTSIKFLDKNIKLENLLDEWNTNFKTSNHKLVPDEYLNLNNNTSSAYLSNIRHNYIEQKFGNTNYLKYLHYSQLIGIKYFHDIEKRIPKKEIAIMENIIKTLVNKMQKELIVTVCGSYRRGNKDSGDIDILLTHPLIKEKSDFESLNQNILLKLIQVLTNIGFLYDHITVDGHTKYMGICRVNGELPYRRIDIRFIEYNAFPAALLYFTGSANLNKQMRIEAMKKGYKLNEYGLYRLEYDKKLGKEVEGERLDATKEKDIFKHLGMKYLKPTERNIK